jgi:hypothetical protein
VDLELDICVWLLVQSSNIFLKLNKLNYIRQKAVYTYYYYCYYSSLYMLALSE